MVICLERGSDLHMAQLMPLPVTVSCFSKIQIVFLPFWYRLTRVVPEKGHLTRVCFIPLFLYLEWVKLLISDFISEQNYTSQLSGKW